VRDLTLRSSGHQILRRIREVPLLKSGPVGQLFWGFFSPGSIVGVWDITWKRMTASYHILSNSSFIVILLFYSIYRHSPTYAVVTLRKVRRKSKFCMYKGVQVKSRLQQTGTRSQHNGPAACVITQQYSSTTFVSLRSHSHEDKVLAGFKNVIFFLIKSKIALLEFAYVVDCQ